METNLNRNHISFVLINEQILFFFLLEHGIYSYLILSQTQKKTIKLSAFI